MLVFPAALSRCEEMLLVGAAVAVEGRISFRDEKPTQIMVNSVQDLEAYTKTAGKPKRSLNRVSPCGKLYLKLPSEDSLNTRRPGPS